MKRFTAAARQSRRGRDLYELGVPPPIRLALLWWAFCAALFFGGWPILYSRTNATLVAILLGATAVGVLLVSRATGAVWAKEALPEAPPRIVLLGLLVSLVLFFPSVTAYSGLSVSQFGQAAADQSVAYREASSVISEGSAGRTSVLVLNTLFSPITIGVPPYLALRAIERKRNIDRLLAGAAVLPALVLSVLTGRTQAVGVSVVLIVGALLLGAERSGSRFRFKHWVQTAGLALGLFSLLAWRAQSRLDGAVKCMPGQLDCRDATASFASVISVSSYASQGFEGLGRAMEGRWAFGGGFAHAPALQNFFLTFLGREAPSGTITSQLADHGWDESGYWSTGWSQLANDVPWVITPLAVAFIALVLVLAWNRSVETGGWLPVAVFAYAFVGLVFMPQNFQLGASGPTYIGAIVLTTVFLSRETLRQLSKGGAKIDRVSKSDRGR